MYAVTAVWSILMPLSSNYHYNLQSTVLSSEASLDSVSFSVFIYSDQSRQISLREWNRKRKIWYQFLCFLPHLDKMFGFNF